MKKNHYLKLDSLRGIAATLVMLFHVNWVWPFYHVSLIRNGFLLVDFFFVLSGFVMAENYLLKIYGGADFKSFIKKRFFRLYPLHFTLLIIFVIIEVAKFFADKRFGSHFDAFAPPNDFKNLIASIVLMQGFGFNNVEPFNAPSWSISTEFYTYIIFGAFCILISKKNTLRIALWGLIIVLLSISTISLFHQLPLVNALFDLIRTVYGFFLGVITWIIFKQTQKLVFHKNLNLAFFGISFIAFIYCLASPPACYPALFPLLSSLLVLSILFNDSVSYFNILETKFLKLLGRLSYSIYMVHFLIYYVMFIILVKAMKVPSTGDELHRVIHTSNLFGLVLIMVFFGISLSLAYLTNIHIENRFRKSS